MGVSWLRNNTSLRLFLIGDIFLFRPVFSRFYLSHVLVPFSPGVYHGELFPVFCTNQLSLFLSTPAHKVLGSRGGEWRRGGVF